MRNIISIVVFTLALASCTTIPYGNFIKDPGSLDQQKIATDTVRQLVTLYPPAKTRFALKHAVATPDVFGRAFVQGLRNRGYALSEFDPKAKDQEGLPLHYVLDQATGTNLYRVTILIGDQSITRQYVEQNNVVAPAGYWTRKE